MASFADRMDNEQSYGAADEGRTSRRGRLMGKLFKAKDKDKDRKAAREDASAASLDAFLHSSSDNLSVAHPPPPPTTSLPKLAKLDTTIISRYPQALSVSQTQQNRPLATGRLESRSPKRSPRPGKKGLVVRFADSHPEVIGEGGDESEIPVADISKRKPAKKPSIPPAVQRGPAPLPNRQPGAFNGDGMGDDDDDFRPKPLVRTQTGFSSIYDSEPETKPEPEPEPKQQSPEPPRREQDTILIPGKPSPARFLGASDRHDDNRKSYIDLHQAQMRQAEGRAFAKAARTVSAASQHAWEEKKPPPPSQDLSNSPDSPPSAEADMKGASVDYSPASASTTSSTYPSNQSPSKDKELLSVRSLKSPKKEFGSPPASMGMASRALSVRITDAATAKEALDLFVARTKHLFELFRLQAESRKPMSSCSPTQCVRAGLWWFLKGRMGLESAIRDRPSTPRSQLQNDLDRQQAYSNLSKGYWLCELVLRDITRSQEVEPEVSDVSQSLISALAKLSISMKRNGLLPPEDAFLPQTIDKSIWLEYPPLSQDMVALLTGNWGSGLTAMQTPMSYLELLDAFPLGDTPETFSFGRISADVFLMEQGRENHRLYFPSMLSMVRPVKQSGLVFVLASQDGNIQLPIQEIKNAGPVWEDVRWRNETCTLDVRLPRGFMLVVQLTQTDYRMLWGMYDFVTKLRATLQPRGDEQLIFRNTLPSFQYLDADPQSRLFPKEPVAQCEVALFESIYKEGGPSGPRSRHTGFRIAVVTGSRTKTASGVQHTFPPPLPTQFGFFRGEGDAPAFSVKIENGRQKGRMIMVFSDENERFRFHSLLTGTAIDHGEKIFSDVPIKNFSVSQSLREPTGMAPFSRMPWRAARVVNDEYGPDGEEPTTVLADRLRVVLEYQHGTITDRINVAPGELRIRLEVSNAKVLRLLRQQQQDMTMSVSEAQVPKELPRNMSDSLQLMKMNQTIRSIEFNNLKDLHSFQAAVTGFEVIFDALAVTFAISRRRMVVPIHKKWEAGYTRIQVVKQEDKQLQLLAFFEGFHHGHCMNFLLKGTDVYESFHRGSKSGLKFIDAKFPLPRLPEDKDGDYDDMAFVCLDLPDLPGEHDDISIMFEREEDRDRLCQCLPAPVKGSSRISRLK
ncbi:hypothetical protein PT974_08605 [Cladobotryum mycophilum]|uniref:Uncharacterized protein n=1 Tax=Cladobotryum mycophilum TaxID=491253 RepID=A0ABR0SDS7_9HYPO